MNVLLQKVLYTYKKLYWCQLRIKCTPEKNSFYSPLKLLPKTVGLTQSYSQAKESSLSLFFILFGMFFLNYWTTKGFGIKKLHRDAVFHLFNCWLLFINSNEYMTCFLNYWTGGSSQRKFTTLGPLKQNTPTINDTTTKYAKKVCFQI